MKTAPQTLSRVATMIRMGWRQSCWAVLMGTGLVMLHVPAQAARVAEDVAQLIEQGKIDQAAKMADGFLQQNARDVEMRFLRGVIAAEQKQNAQAIKIFTALTREYPNMPEPYNNLAVLYAADGQERKAAETLEQAIRTNPSYATAHENLGDLYARMASEAYTKALQLDGSSPDTKPKLSLITQVTPGGATSAKTGKPAAMPVTAPGPAPVVAVAAPAPKPEPVVVAKVESAKPVATSNPPAPVSVSASKPEPMVVAKVEPVVKPVAPPVVVAPPPPAPAPVVASAPASAKPVLPEVKKPEPVVVVKTPAPSPVPAAEAKPAVNPAIAEVERVVHAWAKAWAGQDVPGYLDAYSDKFSPAGGGSLAAWKEGRRQRIVGKQSIAVNVRDLQVTVNGNDASAKFRQNYVAGSLNTTTRKTLTMQREKGGWHIVRESTGG